MKKSTFKHLLFVLSLFTPSLMLNAQVTINNGIYIRWYSTEQVQVNTDLHISALSADWVSDSNTQIYAAGDVHVNTGVQTILGGTWHFNGNTGPQTISGSSFDVSLDNVIINNDLNLESDLSTYTLSLDGGHLNLNGQAIYLATPTDAAIEVMENGGGIISEHPNSKINWYATDNFGFITYNIPFINNNGDDVGVTFSISDMGEAVMPLSISTYGTTTNNEPLPSGVTNMDFNGEPIGEEAINRFWNIDVGGRSIDAYISYSQSESDDIATDNLIALYWNGSIWETSSNGGSTYIGNTFNLSIDESGIYTLADTATALASVRAHIKYWMEGAVQYSLGGFKQMTNYLFENGLVGEDQPFSQAPWNYNGNESIDLTNIVPEDYVDWVLLEIRSATDNNNIIQQKACLLTVNGTLVDVATATQGGTIYDGVDLTGLEAGNNYYVSVKSRNHIGLLSANALALPNDDASTPLEEYYDFGIDDNVMGGAVQLSSNNSAPAGDFNGDGVISVSDFNSYVLTASAINQYMATDVNLDGNVTVSDFNWYQPNSSRIGVSQIRY